MKSFLLFFAFVSVLSSCTTAYHTGQTPDDVYYSPARPQQEYVRVENKEERQYRGNNNRRNDDDYYTYDDDRYLRYKIRNRDRWSYLDDYYRDPYAYNYYNKNYYNTYSNSRSYWNTYFNPYSGFCNPYPTHVMVVNTKSPVYNRPRTYNLHVFDDPKNNSYTPKAPNANARDYKQPSYNNRSDTRNTGNVLREVFGSLNNNSSSPNTNSSSNNSSNNSSGNKTSTDNNSNKSSSSNAPVRKF